MKKLRWIIPVFFVLFMLWACGGKQAAPAASPAATTAAAATAAPTTAAPTTAAPKETQAPAPAETKAPETETEDPADTETEEAADEAAPAEEEDPEDSFLGEGYDGEALTKEGFITFFDYLLTDNEMDPKDFFLTFEGKTYRYADLGDLYDAMEPEGGGIVMLLGELEEELDFEIMAGYLAFFSDMPAWADEPAGPSREFIDRFYGDWHGVVQFRDCTGKYVNSLGADPNWATSIARIYIDSDGYVVPFIGLHVEDTPIKDLEAVLDEENDCLLLSGSWISVPFEDIPMTEKNGTLHAEIPISKEAGSVTLVFNFRHLNDIGWTNEDPALPEDYIVHCQGWSFDRLAEANGYSLSDYVQYSAGEEPEYPVQIVKEEPKEDFGKTTKDADGVVTKEALQKGYNAIMAELDKSGHDPVHYEMARDWFGKDGKKASASQWHEGRHIYEWQTADGKDWVNIRFTVYTDGSERLDTINQSEGILNGRK